MFSRTCPRLAILIVVLVGAGLPAAAQDSTPRRGFSKMLNVDALVDNYIRVLSRKYDLSDDQASSHR